MKYEVTENTNGETVILRFNEDGSVTSFMADSSNSDYQAYLESLNEAKTK